MEERYEKENERIDALDSVVNDHEEMTKNNMEKMGRIGDQMEEYTDATSNLKDEMESLRGKKGEEEGRDWGDEAAQRFVKFGYKVEINSDREPDIVIKEPLPGNQFSINGHHSD